MTKRLPFLIVERDRGLIADFPEREKAAKVLSGGTYAHVLQKASLTPHPSPIIHPLSARLSTKNINRRH